LTAGGCVRVASSARPAAASEIAPSRGWIAVEGIEPLRQKGVLDCGPTALAMVARRWGVEIAPASVRRQSGRGATVGALRTAARASGLTAFAIKADRATLVHELARGRPVLVGLLRGTGRKRVSHFEVVVGYHPKRGQVATIDPSAGFAVRGWADLASEWDPAGRPALVVLGRAGVREARADSARADSARRDSARQAAP
jgi:ABC-type bacteriocin/lantibiotic exporter with double-glycine peptidase domain